MNTQDSSRLAAINFSREIERLTKDFTGREWIFDEIDNWLKHEDKRFFILTGEPGVGKSAIAAQLTQVRPDDIAAYHFCIAGRNSTVRPNTALRSLAAQLGDTLPGYGEALANTIKPLYLSVQVNIDVETMTGGEITGVVINHLHASDPKEELDILLCAPLAELSAPPAPMLILVDSLDEAVTYQGDVNLVTLLAQVDDLPSWVRFLCTTRSERRVLSYLNELVPHVLAAESQMNLDDVRQYIDHRVGKKRLRARLEEAEVMPQTLVDRVAKLARGNFLYTNVLLNDVETGQQPLDDLATLPKSLDDIYHRFLRRFTVSEWEDRYQPLLGVLAAAQEPLTEDQLVGFTRTRRTKVHQYLGILLQFLDKDEDEHGRTVYALFHQSLRDYLLDGERNRDFWCAPEDGHESIQAYFLKQYQDDWGKCDLYGLRYLPVHLVGADQYGALHDLLLNFDWLQAKFVRFQGDGAYVDDLELATNPYQDPLSVDELLRFVQLTAMRLVVNVRAIAYNDDLLRALVWRGRRVEALNHARLRNGTNAQLEGLFSIYVASTERDSAQEAQKALLDELLQVAFTATDETVLKELAQMLARGGCFDDALAVARHMPDGWQKSATLSGIERVKTTGTFQIPSQTRVSKRRVRRDDSRRPSYEAVAAKKKDDVLEYIKNRQLDRALVTAKSIKHASVQVSAYRAVIGALIAAGLFEQTQEVIQLLDDPQSEQGARAQLATALVQLQRFDDALQQTEHITNPQIRAKALHNTSMAMVRLGETDLALEVAGSISDRGVRTNALAEIALHLAKAGDALAVSAYGLAYKATWDVADDRIKIIVLCNIVDALAQSGDTERARDLFVLAAETIQLVQDEKDQTEEIVRRVVATLVRTHLLDQIIGYAPAIGEPIVKQNAYQEYRFLVTGMAGHADPTADGTMFELQKLKDSVLESVPFRQSMDQGSRVIVSELLRIGKYEWAVEMAKHISTDRGGLTYPLADALGNIIGSVGYVSDRGRVLAFLDQVYENSHRMQNVFAKPVLDRLVWTLIRIGHYQKAMDVIQSEYQPKRDDSNLRSFAVHFARAGQMNLARQVAQLISRESKRNQAIDQIDEIQNENSPTMLASPQKPKEVSTGSKPSPKSVVPSDLTPPLVYCQIMREFGLQSMDAYLHLITDWHKNLPLQYPDAPDLWLRIVRSALEIICWVRTDWIEARNILLQAKQN
ncbi:MAG: ATP-binding protein [Chloroflexi bacterium]|nr:ATP-binding protein [Chloroflexota bacterium]